MVWQEKIILLLKFTFLLPNYYDNAVTGTSIEAPKKCPLTFIKSQSIKKG